MFIIVIIEIEIYLFVISEMCDVVVVKSGLRVFFFFLLVVMLIVVFMLLSEVLSIINIGISIVSKNKVIL